MREGGAAGTGARTRQSEQPEEFLLRQCGGEIEADIVHDLLKEFTLLTQFQIYALRDSIGAEVAKDRDRVTLPHPLRATFRLLLYRRVPSPVQMEYVRGRLQVQPDLADAQRKQQDFLAEQEFSAGQQGGEAAATKGRTVSWHCRRPVCRVPVGRVRRPARS